MTIALTKSLPSTVAQTVWYSVAAPRRAVRELLSGADLKHAIIAIVILGTAVTAVDAGISTWLDLRNETDDSQFTFFGPGEAAAEALSWAGIAALLVMASYPLIIFFWAYVFGYKDQSRLVRAAVAVGFGSTVFILPAQELAFFYAGASDSNFAFAEVLATALIVSLALSTFYFAEALTISWTRSLLLNVAVFAMIFIGAIFLTFAGFMLYGVFFGFEYLDGAESPS